MIVTDIWKSRKARPYHDAFSSSIFHRFGDIKWNLLKLNGFKIFKDSFNPFRFSTIEGVSDEFWLMYSTLFSFIYAVEDVCFKTLCASSVDTLPNLRRAFFRHETDQLFIYFRQPMFKSLFQPIVIFCESHPVPRNEARRDLESGRNDYLDQTKVPV